MLALVSIIMLAIIVLYSCRYFIFVPKQEPIFPELKKPLLLAHQGGNLLAPTNTMAAFEKAHAIGGVDFLDIDVHMTRDGHVVGIHDSTVERTTNGKGRVDSYTLAELQQLDAGYWFQDLQGEYSYRGKGVRVATIEEIFQVYATNYYLHFEIKDTYPKGGVSLIEEKLWEIIQRYHMEKRVIVASFKQEIVERFRKLSEGQVVLGAGSWEIVQFVLAHKLHMPGLYRRRSNVLSLPVSQMGINLRDRKLIEGAHRLNMQIYYWTIDEKAEMKELLELGADGLFTNRPDVLKELLLEMHLR